MASKSKIKAPKKERTERLTGQVSYPERGTPVRMAADRTARINAVIVEILKKTAKFPPELAHGLHQDAE